MYGKVEVVISDISNDKVSPGIILNLDEETEKDLFDYLQYKALTQGYSFTATAISK